MAPTPAQPVEADTTVGQRVPGVGAIVIETTNSILNRVHR
ncbi:hypothetical protein ABH937_001177 [Kitasatospora sp. GAS1066B]